MGQESASESKSCLSSFTVQRVMSQSGSGGDWTGLPQPKTEAECSPITSASGHAICGPDLRPDYPLQKHT